MPVLIRLSQDSARSPFLLMLLSVGLLLLAEGTFAHGGVSLEDDLCIMKIGKMRAHFTGYQPKVRASQEFCEDIPELGEAIVVLDFLNPVLRKMNVEFLILKDIKGKAANTTFSDIEMQLENSDDFLVEKKAATYPAGSISVSLTIDEAGWYVGVVSAENPETKEKVVSVFPFSVGEKSYFGFFLWVVAIVTVALAFYFLSVGLNRPEPDDVD